SGHQERCLISATCDAFETTCYGSYRQLQSLRSRKERHFRGLQDHGLTATRIYCAFYIFYYTAPTIFALGYFTALVISVVVYCLGCAALTVSSLPSQLDRGEEVITDRQLTLQYIYNLYFWFATVYLELHSGFTLAYALCLGFITIAAVLLAARKRWPCEGNVLPAAASIITCAFQHSLKMAHAQPQYQLEPCRVLIAFVVFYVCFNQMQNNLILQAVEMETHSTPNDLILAMNQVSYIIFAPLIQEVLYPFLYRRRIYLRLVTRISIGFSFVAASMLYATVIQHFIYSSVVQAPLYFLLTISEVFAIVTAIEYAYDNSPKNIKVIVQAISLLIASASSAIAITLTPAARNPLMVSFYSSLTAAITLTTIIFCFVFRRYDKPTAKDKEASITATGTARATIGLLKSGSVISLASRVYL
ncbi:hypothetical protein J1614_003902, partial [Plenodomus biglobosus]